MRFFRQDIKRAFGGKGFWLSIVLLTAVFVRAIWLNTNFDGGVGMEEILTNAMALSGFTPFAAIFPVLVYSTPFCEEYHSGYLKMILTRMGWKSYGFWRMLSTGLAGGISMAIPFAVVSGIACRYGTYGLADSGYYAGTRVQQGLELYGDGYVLVGKVILGFMFGCCWALVGMAFAVWAGNRYVALLAPFVLYEVLWIALFNVPYMNPIFLVRGEELGSFGQAMLMQGLYILVAVTAVGFGLAWRLHDE